ncbi:hypothetical protein HMPREF0083_06171 [Aneurinibacillus aneurinilyticus ATCC 12856]|uniref:Uncharacterized protein n=1 Tax=Aneurinibacillus aneurinilyticus ATCC 12856 TaxID=649747 RepID=U1W6Q1_ANEAE|nr:hypothetical protein HMPREF0083_06171 [Aneurinibacillus aneurinilyticus ATCC 12856]
MSLSNNQMGRRREAMTHKPGDLPFLHMFPILRGVRIKRRVHEATVRHRTVLMFCIFDACDAIPPYGMAFLVDFCC